MDNKIIVNGQVVAHSSNSYNNLDEVTLPMINSAKLIGNLTSSELNMYTKAEVEKLVASARSVKLVENYPSSPSAGILYYVGTEAPYQVCTYSTDTLARIDLGSTETDLSDYVKLIPSHKDETGKVIYEIGHNEGIDDGRELVAHSVTGIINEIDTALQDRVNVLENDLTTENKKVVEAINELNDVKIPVVSTKKTSVAELLESGSGVYTDVVFADANESPDGSTDSAYIVTVRKNNPQNCSYIAHRQRENLFYVASTGSKGWSGWVGLNTANQQGNSLLLPNHADNLYNNIYYTFGDMSSENRRGYMKLFEVPYIGAYSDVLIDVKVRSSYMSCGMNGEILLQIRRGSTNGLAKNFEIYSKIIEACDNPYGSITPALMVYKSATDSRVTVYLICDGQYYRGTVEVNYRVCKNNTAGGGNTISPVVDDTCGKFLTVDPKDYTDWELFSFTTNKVVVTQSSGTGATITCDAYRIPSSNMYSIFMTVTMKRDGSGTVGQMNLIPNQFYETAGSTAGGKIAGIAFDASGNVSVHGTDVKNGDAYRVCFTIPCRTRFK